MKLHLNNFINSLEGEVVLFIKEAKEQLQGSVNDFREELAHLKDDLIAELEKIRERLRL